MAEFQPLPAKPTNADLANGLGQLHDCFEQFKVANAEKFDEFIQITISHRKQLAENQIAIADELAKTTEATTDALDQAEKGRQALKSQLTKVEAKVNLAQSNLTLLNTAFKLPTLLQNQTGQLTTIVDPTKDKNNSKPIAFMTQREAIWKLALAIGGGMSAVFAIWRFIGFAWHPALQFLIQLNHWVLTGQH